MANKYLQHNTDSTECLISAPHVLALYPLKLNLLSAIWMLMGQTMTLDQHVNTLVHSCFDQLRYIAKPIVPRPQLNMIIHAFISSQLDYCNSLFACLSKTSRNCSCVVQIAHNIWCNTNPYVSHWLPIQFRITFKILVITFRALHGEIQTYIQDLLMPCNTSRTLRSTDQSLFSVPCIRLKAKGDWL